MTNEPLSLTLLSWQAFRPRSAPRASLVARFRSGFNRARLARLNMVASLASALPFLVLVIPPVQASISLVREWKAAPVLLQHVEFSPDGQALLTASGGGVGQLWSLDGTPGPQLTGQRPPMFNAHFSPDGRQLITTGYDGSAWIWSLGGQRLHRYSLHRAATAEARFLPSSTGANANLVSSSDDGQIVIRDLQGQPTWHGQFVGTARQFSINSTNSLIVASSDDGQLHLIRPNAKRSAAEVFSFQTPHGRINQISLSPDEQRFAVAGTDGGVTVWNLDGSQAFALRASTHGWSRGVSFCQPTTGPLLTIGDDGVVREWSRAGTLLSSLQLSSRSNLTSIDCSANGRQAAVVGSRGELWLLAVNPIRL